MDHDFGDLGGFDDLRLRFVFVPDGQSVPEEVLAEFGEVVRIPAQFVPRWEPEPPANGRSRDRGGRSDHLPAVVTGSDGDDACRETPTPGGAMPRDGGERAESFTGLSYDYGRSYAPLRRGSRQSEPFGYAEGNNPANLRDPSAPSPNQLGNPGWDLTKAAASFLYQNPLLALAVLGTEIVGGGPEDPVADAAAAAEITAVEGKGSVAAGNKLPTAKSQLGHIFRSSAGHLSDTPSKPAAAARGRE